MSHLRQTVLTVALAVASYGAWAQTDAGHTQHHPATSVSKGTAKAAKVPAVNTAAKDSMAAMDSKMKAMREMHEKMMNAKTPEERNALMAEHMKAMQDGMAMMSDMGPMSGMGNAAKGGMKGGMTMDMASHHQMMEKCMEMMTSMMQMMMDRMPTEPAK